ncbi:MAG: sugar phosphate isomerase/epimerase [Anaerolineae bacterium]|nr:sugar phosphate isomerase/epimerase [Anaerolineae bacterium]
MPAFGFRTGIFGGLTTEQAAAELKRIGYDCVEICLEAPDVRPETLDEPRCRQLRAALDEIGIGLASLSYHADREPFEQRRTNQERAVQAAHWMGVDILVLNPEKSVEQARQWAEHVAHFEHLCALADRLGVTIAIEPEPLLVVGSSDDMARLIDEVGSPRLGVNLDIGHAQITDDDLIASIHKLGKNIVHLHLEDIKDRVHRHLPFGRGDIDFARVRRALGDIGYAGPYVVDLFGQVDAQGQTVPPGEVAALALHGMKERFG